MPAGIDSITGTPFLLKFSAKYCMTELQSYSVRACMSSYWISESEKAVLTMLAKLTVT